MVETGPTVSSTCPWAHILQRAYGLSRSSGFAATTSPTQHSDFHGFHPGRPAREHEFNDHAWPNLEIRPTLASIGAAFMRTTVAESAATHGRCRDCDPHGWSWPLRESGTAASLQCLAVPMARSRALSSVEVRPFSGSLPRLLVGIRRSLLPSNSVFLDEIRERQLSKYVGHWARKVPTAAVGRTATDGDGPSGIQMPRSETGHLLPSMPKGIRVGNGRSQDGAAIACGRRRGDGISRAAVKDRRRQRTPRARFVSP